MSASAFGYRAEEEGHQPSRLLEFAKRADSAGFEFVAISDHFHPWFHTGAAGGFAWTWMSSAAAVLPRMRFGTMVTAPIGRYHPGLVAQAFATMDEMFPDRFFLGLGTGEAMNEVPLGLRWPRFEERLQRLRESIEIIRRLWTEDFVTYEGKYFKLKGANLYTRPRGKVPIYVAALGPKSAELVGSHADGYAISSPFLGRFRDTWEIIARSARKAGRDPSTIRKNLELFLSFDEDYDRALRSASKWKPGLIPGVLGSGLNDPRELEREGGVHSDEELSKAWNIATSAEDIIKSAMDAMSYGFEEIQFHSASPSEEKFIDACNKEVIPCLRSLDGRGHAREGLA
ncbi:MAG: TIGR03557 family F420-dependent LLM class oxidoreductase [Nitrososphaerota archaeon]|nr:TIGR03557 family F420-dependent LLM class oxidoreductase [Nitrososphaerota archaeon]MDG6947256.1 TIGR03557 family F420-dependent LLM class oxidoreductase [Nitrososphaerota archaeon]MDG6955311.1 TIGR03557 family F420-dependent LLM class oxidoreductase [Nitrososphaerota archaeon]